MVTVFQVCKEKGFLDRITCGLAGQYASDHYSVMGPDLRERVISYEPHGVFSVWAYPDELREMLERSVAEANAKINSFNMGNDVPAINALIHEIKQEKEREQARGRRPRIQGRRVDRG